MSCHACGICCSTTAQVYLVIFLLLATWFPSYRHPAFLGTQKNRQVSQMTFILEQGLHSVSQPLPPCALWIFLDVCETWEFFVLPLGLGPVAGARPSATFRGSPPRQTPAQVNSGSVDGACEPQRNMGASLTRALELLDPLQHSVYGNIELGVLSIAWISSPC